MPDTPNNPMMDAAADLLEAASNLVRAASAPPTGDSNTTVAPPGKSVELELDSPAWYDIHHPTGSAGVHDLGEAYFNRHAPATKGANNMLLWDPSVGATWKDFARIGRRLFDQSQVFNADNTFRSAPFDGLRLLQRMLGRYKVDDPETLVTLDYPWPTSPNFPALNPAWKQREAIAAYLSFFNVDPATGASADRSKDFPPAPGGALKLTHGQCVELRHILVTQEDIRLVAPYDILNTLAW